MAPDLMEKTSMLYYVGKDGTVREMTGAFNFSLSESQEKTYCDIDSSILEEQHSLSIKLKNKQIYRFMKAIGLIKPVYKKKRKGKRFIYYEVY